MLRQMLCLEDIKCGVCGDEVSIARPRPNEYGGKYNKEKKIAAKYTMGQVGLF